MPNFRRGDVFEAPGGTKHAFRNASSKSASALIVTTMALARFFRRVGVASAPPGSSEALQLSAQASLAQGHWLGGAVDNAAVGIKLISFN